MYCKYCGEKVHSDAVVCTNCGRQIREIKVNNVNSNTNTRYNTGNNIGKNKWIALILCFLLGYLGAHRFYEGKYFTGFIYLFTLGLFFIGVFADFIILLGKPTNY